MSKLSVHRPGLFFNIRKLPNTQCQKIKCYSNNYYTISFITAPVAILPFIMLQNTKCLRIHNVTWKLKRTFRLGSYIQSFCYGFRPQMKNLWTSTQAGELYSKFFLRLWTSDEGPLDFSTRTLFRISVQIFWKYWFGLGGHFKKLVCFHVISNTTIFLFPRTCSHNAER